MHSIVDDADDAAFARSNGLVGGDTTPCPACGTAPWYSPPAPQERAVVHMQEVNTVLMVMSSLVGLVTVNSLVNVAVLHRDGAEVEERFRSGKLTL